MLKGFCNRVWPEQVDFSLVNGREILRRSLTPEFGQKVVMLMFFQVLTLVALLPRATFAQTTGPIDTTQIQASVTSLTTLIQQLSGIFLVLLMMAGSALLMWGGFNQNLQRTGIRGITLAVCGAAIVFLFASPLAAFFVTTFQAGAGTGA